MRKGKVIIVALILVFAIGFISSIFRPNIYNSFTGFLIKDSSTNFHPIISYITGIILIGLVAVYIIKYFFGSLLMGIFMRPAEAMEQLLLEFEMAKDKNDLDSAKNLASRIKHLYDHLLENQKPFFRVRVKQTQEVLSKK